MHLGAPEEIPALDLYEHGNQLRMKFEKGTDSLERIEQEELKEEDGHSLKPEVMKKGLHSLAAIEIR